MPLFLSRQVPYLSLKKHKKAATFVPAEIPTG